MAEWPELMEPWRGGNRGSRLGRGTEARPVAQRMSAQHAAADSQDVQKPSRVRKEPRQLRTRRFVGDRRGHGLASGSAALWRFPPRRVVALLRALREDR